MKAQLLFFFIAILSWQCSQPTASAQVSKSKDYGSKIKTIENYKVNPETGDKTHVSSEHFDDLGNLVKSFSYNSYPNNDTQEMNCTYDVQGNKKCITTDESGKETYRHEETYDGKKLIEEKTTYDSKKYSYDKNGNVILEEEFDSEGIFSKAEKYELIYKKGTTDLKGKITYEKRDNGDFQKHGETFYIYENGQLKKEIDVASFYRYEYHYEYFPNGNLKEKITLQGDSEKVITKFHENGNRRIEAIFRSKTADSEMILAQKNKWTYDKHGNEVMFESFRNEKLSSKRIQEITYY